MLTAYLLEFWKVLTALAPWMFLGAGIAGLMRVFLPAGFVNQQVGKSNLLSVLKSVLVGVPLPLCSCGVIPAAIGLKNDGASNGAAVGFLISTPQTGADSVLVTGSFLGWPLAAFKVIAALVTGVAGGTLVDWFGGRGRSEMASGPGAACALATEVKASPWREFLHYSVEELIGGVYRYLLLGIAVAALISLAVPPNYISRMPALQGPLGMLAMLAVSIPLYVCSTGSVPIAASLIQAGLPLGSAVVFLMAGPATNAATIGAVYRTFGRRITLIYLLTIVLGSVAFGLLFQSLFGLQAAGLPVHRHETPLRHVIEFLAAVVLAGLMARWTMVDLRSWLKTRRTSFGRLSSLEEAEFRVEGMTCENCAKRIRHALESLPGVKIVEVAVESGRIVVKGKPLDQAGLSAAIQAAGYRVRSC